MHVWMVVFGKTASIASGKPFRPSQRLFEQHPERRFGVVLVEKVRHVAGSESVDFPGPRHEIVGVPPVEQQYRAGGQDSRGKQERQPLATPKEHARVK